jgi:hypothetical protein
MDTPRDMYMYNENMFHGRKDRRFHYQISESVESTISVYSATLIGMVAAPPERSTGFETCQTLSR